MACSEDNLSKPKKTKITQYFKPSSSSILPYVHGSSRSSQQTSPPVQAGQKDNLSTNNLANDEPSSTEVSSSKSSKMRKAAYSTYSFRKKLEVLDFAKAHSESEASRHFKIARTTLRLWIGLELLPKEKLKSSTKGKHLKKGSGHYRTILH